MTEDGDGRIAEQGDREFGQGEVCELVSGEPGDVDRLLPVGTRLAVDDARVEDSSARS